ncbi:excalibur calcium-binding domain-containing protein [Phyllobacterium zundukense]|uniref:Excalibur calcium-binding domain-containing protein n=1 Tax=Phyllobacterium zundukense TaxID=1867719 RepID=A0A2N9VS55_9HYPH|nr:hypothetical protein B5P45_25195 [Phyllobacterium zundukense]
MSPWKRSRQPDQSVKVRGVTYRPLRRRRWQPGWVRFLHKLSFPLGVVALLFVASYLFADSELDSRSDGVSNFVSAPRTCRSAPFSAHRGQPGYWSHLDRDNDGISCEPRPR